MRRTSIVICSCFKGDQFPQFVVGSPFGSGSHASSCFLEINHKNWKHEHSVTIAAKVDLKQDGDQVQKLILVARKIVNGVVTESQTICTYTVKVVDKDTKLSLCKVANDPHVQMFNQRRLELHQQGWFHIYRHKKLPLEVQAGFQKCAYAACICAVAVRAGDSVFHLDRCRKRGVRYCKKCNLLSGKLYFNERVTPGFKIFSSEAGSKMDIQLPNGAVVTLKEDSFFFNIVISPSSSDYLNTEGICGEFGGDYPWILPSGEHWKAPRFGGLKQYFAAWRVADEDLLINGVPRNPFELPEYCDCLERPDAPFGSCDSDGLTNACGPCTKKCDDVTKVYPSVNLHEPKKKEQQELTDVADYEFDYESSGNTSAVDPNWDEVEALKFCQKAVVEDSEAVKTCLQVPEFDTYDHMEWCTRDLLVRHNIFVSETEQF